MSDCLRPHGLQDAQIHVHWVSDAIQPSHPLLPPSPPALNPIFPNIKIFSKELVISSITNYEKEESITHNEKKNSSIHQYSKKDWISKDIKIFITVFHQFKMLEGKN